MATLQDSDRDVRRAAVEALGLLGDEAVGMRVVDVLEGLGAERAVEPLAAVLQDDGYRVRWRAAVALSRLGDARGLAIVQGAA